MSVRVFISYRRGDSRHTTGRLRDHLVEAFGEEDVFLDVHSIEFGRAFRDEIHKRLQTVDVVLIVIGPQFDIGRLADEQDYVRFELLEAMRLDKLIVPVLVEDAGIPRAADLPEALRWLPERNVVHVRSDPDFSGDVARLLASISRSLGREIPRPERSGEGKSKYQINVSGTPQGTVIGDSNTVHQSFGPPAPKDDT